MLSTRASRDHSKQQAEPASNIVALSSYSSTVVRNCRCAKVVTVQEITLLPGIRTERMNPTKWCKQHISHRTRAALQRLIEIAAWVVSMSHAPADKAKWAVHSAQWSDSAQTQQRSCGGSLLSRRDHHQATNECTVMPLFSLEIQDKFQKNFILLCII